MRRTKLLFCHDRHADGTPRPLCRGWLHGIALVLFVRYVVDAWHALEGAARPAVVAIVWTLACSSLVHLVPWASIRVEELVTRLDRAGIIAICGASFMFPQLVDRGICRATPLFSLATVALPCIVGAGRVLLGHGNDSYSVGISMGIAAISTTGFLACYVDTQAATWSIVTVLLYGTGMLVYALKPFADAPFSMVFDFHDIIMHCLVKKPPGLFQTRWGCSTLARFATRHDMGLDPVFCALASKRLECLRKQWSTGAL